MAVTQNNYSVFPVRVKTNEHQPTGL